MTMTGILACNNISLSLLGLDTNIRIFFRYLEKKNDIFYILAKTVEGTFFPTKMEKVKCYLQTQKLFVEIKADIFGIFK